MRTLYSYRRLSSQNKKCRSSNSRGIGLSISPQAQRRRMEYWWLSEIPFSSNTTTPIRYLITICAIAQTNCTLVNIYGPNPRQFHFFRHLYKKVDSLQQENVVMGGDLNIIGDPHMHTSTNKGQHRPALNPLLHDLDHFDVWRSQHGSQWDYTYFSHLQLSYSHIDSFLVDKWSL